MIYCFAGTADATAALTADTCAGGCAVTTFDCADGATAFVAGAVIRAGATATATAGCLLVATEVATGAAAVCLSVGLFVTKHIYDDQPNTNKLMYGIWSGGGTN
jgi:hypothetical protein